MILVAIVEDHPAIADGLAALLHDTSELTVVGTAHDIRSATRLIDQAAPQVVLCDIRLADGDDGLELVGRYRSGPAFIILSAYWYPSYHVRALELGAKGYLSKTATVEEISDAIKTVADGGTAFPAAARQAVREALRMPTPREMDIIRLVAEGCSNAEIAERLSLRVKTIESQLRRLFDRYDLPSRTALIHLAGQQGWSDDVR